MNKTVTFIENYLKAINFIEGEYIIKETQDSMGLLITIDVKKGHPSIGILIGKEGQNINLLKNVTRIIGLLERVNPFIKVNII